MLVRIWAVGGLAVFLLTGCSDGLPATLPVSGTVTWQGEPLTDGTVVFHPQEIAEGLPRRNATGKLADDGTFSLSTFRTDDGAVPGTYRVTIHSYLSEPSSSDDDQNPGQFQWRIPQRYGDPSRSKLTANVSPDVGNSLEFAFNLDEDE